MAEQDSDEEITETLLNQQQIQDLKEKVNAGIEIDERKALQKIDNALKTVELMMMKGKGKEEVERKDTNKRPWKADVETCTEKKKLKEIEKTMKRIVEEGTTIFHGGLKQKIDALMLLPMPKDKDLKINDSTGNGSEPKRSIDYEKTLNLLKNQGIERGFTLSRVLTDVMLLMSGENYEEMVRTFRVVNSILEWVIRDETSIVINIILQIIQIAKEKIGVKEAEIVAEEVKQAEKVAAAPIEEAIAVGKEEAIAAKEEEESEVVKIIVRLLEEIFRLELFWQALIHPKDPLIMNNALFPQLLNDMNECGQVLREIHQEIGYRMLMGSVNFSDAINEFRSFMEGKMTQMWNVLL